MTGNRGATFKDRSAACSSLKKAKESRKLAKFFGGKALTGTPKQKSWGEAVRSKILASESLTHEEKEQLVSVGGFTEEASFWIDNRDVQEKEFTALNIVSKYRALAELENNFINDRSNFKSVIEGHIDGIAKYMNCCPFNFKTRIDRVKNKIDARKIKIGRY